MNENDNKIFQEVIKFLPTHMLPKGVEVTNDLRLERDFGIYGEDAWYLFLEFSKKFNVNIDNFDISKYFSNESSWLREWFNKLLSVSKIEDKKDLSINDLVLALKKGKLGNGTE
jgi:hypothetical protein